ncbi:hypothetical protein E4U21_002470 [Claviceps maximensis]|nr:hypothetical protein E4U21_002470 [Claviceps maximensis]
MSSLKNETSSSDFGGDQRELRTHPNVRLASAVHSIRVAVTILALSAGIVTLGLSADTLAVYNATHLPADYMLPLWPENFDLRPTHALMAGGGIVTAMNALSLFASNTQSIRGRSTFHSAVSMTVPVVAFVASLVAVVLFYIINASTIDETYQSWVCRWKNIHMSTRPYFGTLCQESQAALAIALVLVPLELIVLASACFQVVLEKKIGGMVRSRGGSAALS